MGSISPNDARCWSWLQAMARVLRFLGWVVLMAPGPVSAAEPVNPAFTLETALQEVGRQQARHREEALRFLMELGRPGHGSLAKALETEPESATKLSGAVLEAASAEDDARALAAVRTLDQWSESAEMALAQIARAAKGKHHERVAAQLRSLGGTVFLREGAIVEVVLNGCRIVDDDLRGLRGLCEITDLSLERTPVGDVGMRYLADSIRLEWLNLFLTQVSDEGLGQLKKLRRLERLPIGGTRVTDAGLKVLGQLPSLKYLGLRGTRITDAGMPAVAGMVGLAELNLSDTAVGDAGLQSLASLRSLHVLYLGATPATEAGIARLSRALPDCTIHR